MYNGAFWIRNGNIFDVDPDSIHTDAILQDPEWFGLSWGFLNDLCKAFGFSSISELRYDDAYMTEESDAWRELIDAALAKGAVRVRWMKDEVWISAFKDRYIIEALLDYPEEFDFSKFSIEVYDHRGCRHWTANSVDNALKVLQESKKSKRPKLKESFECKDDKLFDNIQNAIFSILTDYDNELWKKAGIERYFEEPSTHGVLVRDQYGTKVFPIHYGLNGPGKDEDYFTAMAKIIVDLEDALKPTYPNVNVYCVNVLVDCADDVGTAVFGISVGEDIDPKESMEWKESEGGVGKPQDSDEEKESKWNKGIYEIDHYDPQIDEWE